MDKSAEEEKPFTVEAAAGDTQHQESRRVRRRMVQSTLIPHKLPATESKGDQKSDKECNGVDKACDEEEFCESQGKKKRTRKSKECPQTKTPRATKKEKEASAEEASEKDVTPKKSTPSSTEGAPRKNGTPRKNSTPKKNGMTNGKTAAHLVENGDSLPQIPNLRLEAKMMAEENSRVFAGKQIHPFFMMKNMGSRGHDKTVQSKPKSTTVGPIHVFEREQDDAVPLDWRNWKFNGESFIKSIYMPENAFMSIFECTVKSLGFVKFPSLLHPASSALLQDNISLDASQQELLHEASAKAMPSDLQMECCQSVKGAQTADEAGLVLAAERNLDEQQGKHLQERFISSGLGCLNQLEDRLWTDKYQPQKATEICGNYDSVKLLSEWLQTCSQRGQQASKDPSEYDALDPDYNSTQCDSDSENISEETSLSNVLLITGPVGSGKSAAIYACAKEQGFRVLEANTSECRNGAVVRERFGVLESQSTLDSQLFQWSQDSSIEFESLDVAKSVATLPNGKILQQCGSEVINTIPISDEDVSCEATEISDKLFSKENSVVCGQGQFKPLILFEDVDIIFSEDRGFIGAIQQIADKVKGPVVLTSNSDKPVLPDNLDRLEVAFKMPLRDELLQHINMVCAAEKLNVEPHLVEHLIEFCDRDIRKTIMHLQFWCQGEQFRKGKDGEIQRHSSLLPFDLEAGYQILPKLIPWDFPSQLSELVEKEITMSLCMMEENSILMDAMEDKFDDEMVQDDLKKGIYETDSIEAKKKAMLSKNCSGHDCIDFIGPYDVTCDLFDFSSSPLPFSERSSKRKLVVMSSDSEDDFLKDQLPATPDKDASNKFVLEVEGGFPSHHLCMQKSLNPSTDLFLCCGGEKQEENLYQCSEIATELSIQKSLNPSRDLQLCSGFEKLEENIYQFSETAVDLNAKDACISTDVSCVPESSFVPETVNNDETEVLFGRVSRRQVGQVPELFEEASVSNEFRQTLFPVETDNPDKCMTELHRGYNLVGGTCDVISALPREEAEDSQYELGESIVREPQLMDECSCIDFSRKFKLHGKYRSSTETVRESWRKLRDRHADLKHVVASENKSYSEIMELACGISNLISEAELLHAKCRSLDSLALPVSVSEESNAFSWCNEQLQMASTILEHGFCFFATDIACAGLNMGESRVDSIWSLMSSTNKTKVGVSLRENINSYASDTRLPKNGLLANSERKSHFVNIIQSIVPLRTCLNIKGSALCEYLSSLGHISRSESSRLSEGVDKGKRRRGRTARNYLSTGSLMLSPEEISLLGQSNVYGKIQSQSIDTKY